VLPSTGAFLFNQLAQASAGFSRTHTDQLERQVLLLATETSVRARSASEGSNQSVTTVGIPIILAVVETLKPANWR
jgi:hypothetical protein